MKFKLFWVCFTILLALCGCNNTVEVKETNSIQSETSEIAESINESRLGNSGPQGMRNGGGMQESFLDDEAKAKFEKVYNEVGDKYLQLEFNDERTGLALPYNLFIPESYDTYGWKLITFASAIKAYRKKSILEMLFCVL